MRRQQPAARVGDQRIAGDAGFFLISPRKPAVDDDQSAVGFDGTLAFDHFYRHMTIYDVTGLAVQTKLTQYFLGRLHRIAQCIIGIALFFMGARVRQKVAFEGRHLLFTE